MHETKIWRVRAPENASANALNKWMLSMHRDFKEDPSIAGLALHLVRKDDDEFADVLVLIALDASRPQRSCDDLFVRMCHSFAELLPVASDSELKRALKEVKIGRPFLDSAHWLSRASRIERGLDELSMTHFRSFL